MKRNRTDHNRLRAYVQENWRRKPDFEMARDFDDNTSQRDIQTVRQSLGLIRDPAMLQRMYQAHKDGKIYIGRGANRKPRDQSYKINKYNGNT